RQVEVTAEITADLENVRAMWRHATEHILLAAFEKATMTFLQYCEIVGRFQEGMQSLLKASKSVEQLSSKQARRMRAVFDTWLGWNYLRFGQYGDSKAAFDRSEAFYAEMGISPSSGHGEDPLNGLANLANTQGAYREATEIAEKARKRIAKRGDVQD